MKVSKDAASAARRIYRLCAPEGRLDEDKIRKAFKKIAETKPRDYRAIMHSLLNLVRLDDKSRQALIESATELDTASRSRIEKNLNEQYGGGLSFTYNINADTMAGAMTTTSRQPLEIAKRM